MNERPSLRQQPQHSRHSSISNTSSTSSSNASLSLSILSESSDSIDERDPADESPLRRTVTGNTSSGSATGYSTVTLGLRSFSNTHHALSTAQRIAKDSLPSPPSTSKGESEKGSIGSTNSLRSPAIGSIKHPHSQKRSDARPSLREMQLDRTTPVASPDEIKTARPVVPQMLSSPTDLLSAAIPSPSPAPRLSLDSPNADYVSAREHGVPRSRSVSPLAAKEVIRRENLVLSRSNSQGSLDLNSPGASVRKDTSDRDGPVAAAISRTGSFRSTLSRASSLKGKSREEGQETGSRTPSVSASKIRRISEEVRQRMYKDSSPAAKSPTGDSSYHSIDSHVDSPTFTKPTRKDSLTVPGYVIHSQDMRRQSSSSSGSFVSPSLYQSARSNSASGSSESSPAIAQPAHFPHAGVTESRLPGETAFARTNRNSIISVHSRESETPISPITSAESPSRAVYAAEDGSSSPYGNRRSRAMRQSVELEEGEILSETPPRSVSLTQADSTRYPSRNSPVEVDHPREAFAAVGSARMSKQSSGSTGSENRAFARESLRRSGLLDDGDVQARLSRDGSSRSPSVSPTKRQQRQERSEHYARARYPAVRHSLSTLDLPSRNGEREYTHQNNGRSQPISERNARLSSASTTPSMAELERPVTPAMPRDAEQEDVTPSRRRSQASARNERYERYHPRSADIERRQLDHEAVGPHERQSGTTSVLPRRSQTSLSRYSDRISDSTGVPSPLQARDFPRTANEPSSSNPTPTYGQRRLRHSYSPDRRSVATASRQTITNRNSRGDRASAGSEVYTPSSVQRQSSHELSRHPSQLSRTSPRTRQSPRHDRVHRMSQTDDSEDVKQVLSRARARTLSAQDAGSANAAVARARSEAGRERYDVFTHNQRQMGTPDKYRTIASDRPRTSASIRDMQIASQGWWEEVNEVRRNPTSARSERPASRAGTAYSGRSRGEKSAALSPANNAESSYSERMPAETSVVSTTARQRNGSDPPVHPRNGNRHTPVDRRNNDTRQYTPTSRTISRSETLHIHSSSRDAYTRGATPSLQSEKQLSHHQAILLEALDTFNKHYLGHDSSSLSTLSTSVVETANRITSVSKEMVDQLVAARVEQEVASDNESTSAHSRRPTREMLTARLERSANACYRASNEQVRNLTELLLTLARSVQAPAATNGQNAYDSPAPGRRTEFERRSGSIRRSQTLASHQSRSSLATVEQAPNALSPGHGNAVKPDTEDVLEALPRFGHERMQSEPLGDAHSPRTLRRAKSSSTSQVSQSTVRGYLATSPSRSSTEIIYANTSFQDRSSRRSSLASIEGSFVPDDPASAILVSPNNAEAAHRLEHQLSNNDRPEATPASRWRTFGRKNTQPLDELPDSPSFATISKRHATDNPPRSSELAKTLSRVSSVYRPRRQK